MSTKPSSKKQQKFLRDARNSPQTIFPSEKKKGGRNRPRRNTNSSDAVSPKDDTSRSEEANMYSGESDNSVDRKRCHQSVSFDPSLNSIASNDDSVTNNNKRLQLSVGEEDDQMTEATHRALVEAIYEVGLKHASPSVILEMMTENHKAVTSERVKSHLQKYRNNKEKSKSEFMNEYDAWMQKALTVGAAGGTFSRLASPQAVLEMVGSSGGSDKLLGGDLPAYLTYSVMQEDSELETAAGLQQLSQMSPSTIRSSSNEFAKSFVGAKIPFPILTEEERATPLGESIGHVMGIFHSMTQNLIRERIAREIAETTVAESASAYASVNSVRFAQPPWGQQQQQQQQQYYPTQQVQHYQPSYEFGFRSGDSFYSEQEQSEEEQAAEQYYHQMPASAQQRDSLAPQEADEEYDGEQQPRTPSSLADETST